jgi:hypothetical protein
MQKIRFTAVWTYVPNPEDYELGDDFTIEKALEIDRENLTLALSGIFDHDDNAEEELTFEIVEHKNWTDITREIENGA